MNRRRPTDRDRLPVLAFAKDSPTRRTWAWLIARPHLFKAIRDMVVPLGPDAIRDAVLREMAEHTEAPLMVADEDRAGKVGWAAIHLSMKGPSWPHPHTATAE